ncbi:MAG: hypothetical protein JNK72_12335 [Myxococcales bacterium]|nr:hypothetical protein [Myxococcales bacterium]
MSALALRGAVLALGVMGCSDVPAVALDATRFDARDAVIEPRDVSGADLGVDAGARVDVTLAELPTFDAAMGEEAGGLDVGAALDAGQCGALAEAYADTVREAQRCNTDSQCAAMVCETQCCACQVFVDPNNERYGDVARIRAEWSALGCAAAVRCPGIPCEPAVGAVCSSEGRCVTVRSANRDAGAD